MYEIRKQHLGTKQGYYIWVRDKKNVTWVRNKANIWVRYKKNIIWVQNKIFYLGMR